MPPLTAPRAVRGGGICAANDGGDKAQDLACPEICSVRIPSGALRQRPSPFWQRKRASRLACSLACLRSDRTLNLVGTQASCADIYMARSTVNDCLDTFDVGLPCTVRTSVRMGDLDTECYALAADIAFCHRMHLLAAWKIRFTRYKAPTSILTDCVGNCKHFFRKNPKISRRGDKGFSLLRNRGKAGIIEVS